MELLTATLVIVLLTTGSAKPIGRRWHHDADITDNYWRWPERNSWWYWWCTESSSYEDSSAESDQSLESWESSESSESQSSEESSEEVTDQTTPVMTTTVMTTITRGDGNVLTPTPGTMSTGEPTLNITPPPPTPTTTGVTTSGSVTHCVTEVIPTGAPITNNRGDN